jgi:chromosome partitioning protein
MVLDTDPQKSTQIWATRREDSKGLPVVYAVGRSGRIHTTAQEMARLYDEVIIDVAGTDSVSLRSGLLVADRLYTPVAASELDTNTLYTVDDLVGEALVMNTGLTAHVLINKADTHAQSRDVEEAQAQLSDLKHMQFSGAVLRHRKVWKKAYSAGKGVCECKDAKAKAEVSALMHEIYGTQASAARAA